MRHNIPKKREIAEDHEQDVYFWDGQICVRSSVITIGNPPTNTISVQNLAGVSLAKGKRDPALIALLSLCSLMFVGFTALCIWANWENDYHWIFSGGLALMSSYFLIRLGMSVRPLPWQVTMKMGGMLADEVFSSFDQGWAEKFAQAVSQAIAIEQHRRGGGGQAVPQAPIFLDPTLTRN